MRVVIIVLIVIAVLFAVTAIWGAQGDGGSGGSCPKPDSQEPSAAASWKPCGFIDGFGELMAPFAPSMTLGGVSVPAGPLPAPQVINVPAVADGEENIRFARINITTGAVRASVVCTGSCTPPYSKEPVCACAHGAGFFSDAEIDACGAKWRERNVLDGKCVEEPPKASLIVPREGGELSFVAIGPERAELRIE